MTRNEEALNTMVTSTIIEFYNEYAAQPVKKFQDKATAVRRTAAVLDEAGMEFDEFCQLRPKLNGAPIEDQLPPESAGSQSNLFSAPEEAAARGATTLAPGGFEGEGKTVEAAPSAEVDLPGVDLEQLGEFGLGDSEESAECPHCGINHNGNGWQVHGEDHKCDQMMFECLACGGEWGPKIKRRAATDRQPSLKGEWLAVVGGKDAANPFREGSKSHAAFAFLQANRGATYEELKAAGVRMRAITHGKKEGWIRTL